MDNLPYPNGTKSYYRCEKCKQLLKRMRKVHHDRYECSRNVASFKARNKAGRKEEESGKPKV